MSKIRNIVVWTAKKDFKLNPPKGAKVSYANPRLWTGKVRPRYDAVYAPDYPHIEEAFRKAGRKIYRPDDNSGGDVQPVVQTSEPVQVVESEEEPQKVDEVETTWRNLPWPQLRSKACEHTDEPVKSKEQAIEILEKAEFDGNI